ncbi:MAG: PGF-pre-PGF domain-containing protein, partial [Chloroflexi bacterium]|nr:PGF-pre-PGF domain-containing protein [Chloroflexota bacterium]
DAFTAALVLTEVEPKAAGAALDLVSLNKVVAIVQIMSEVALLDRLPEMSPAKLFSLPSNVLFQKMPNAPTEQLVGEVEPVPDPSLPLPTAVQETSSRVAYTVPATRRGSWSKLVGSPAPIERILGRANESLTNVRVLVEDLLTLPGGIPPLPANLKVNEMFSVNLENAQDSDFSMAHVTTFVEKSWLEENSVHKWSIQFNRFDSNLNQWVPTPSKRVREDENRISYTMVVPGFSTVAITGTTDLPPQIFDVSGLGFFPPRPTASDDVIITATVRNNGSTRAVYPAHLWINGEIDETRLIVVEAGQTAPIRFNRLRPEGQFNVRVDRLTANLNVGAPVATPTPTPTGTLTPTATPTASPVPNATPTRIPVAIATATAVAPISTPTPRPAGPTPTATATPGPGTPTAVPTATPTATATLPPGSYAHGNADGSRSRGGALGSSYLDNRRSTARAGRPSPSAD